MAGPAGDAAKAGASLRVVKRRECFSPAGCNVSCEPGEVIVNAYLAPAEGEVRIVTEREAHFRPREGSAAQAPWLVLVCTKE
ncbi:MAG TPA: hypothetical protein VLA00_05305 [Xanthobacteraceae bacterium]|nr:hypothetical protein [Xanthobacteraceae bacterium]